MEDLGFYKEKVILSTEYSFSSTYIDPTTEKYIKDLSSLILGRALKELKWSQKKSMCYLKWDGDMDVATSKFDKFITEVDMLLTHKG